MGLDFAEIASIMAQRRRDDHHLIRTMKDVRDRYNGDVVFYLPGETEEWKPPIPQLVGDGIDHTAMRAASTIPTISAPALDPGRKGSERRAENRRRYLYGLWESSRMVESVLPRGFRHMVAYGMTAFMVEPDFRHKRARIVLRDPLGAYPSARQGWDDDNPVDCGFVYGKSWQWIRRTYPAAAEAFRTTSSGRSHHISDESLWDIVEWVDQDEIVVGIVGQRSRDSYRADSNDIYETGLSGWEIARTKHRLGMAPVVVPKRITLDRLKGQMDNILHTFDLQGRMMALDVVAAEKAIFPDIYVSGENPELVTGDWKDGRTGLMNVIRNGNVGVLNTSPGPLTHPVIDRLERAQRVSGGILPQFGGEAPTSLRTGRANELIEGSAIDPRIQELQRSMKRHLQIVNSLGLETEKNWWASTTKSFHIIDWPASDGGGGRGTFLPSRDCETLTNRVDYSISGADWNAMSIIASGLKGAGLISSRTAMRLHPAIVDPEGELDEIVAERVRDAALAGFLQQASQGQVPLVDAAFISQKVREGVPIEQAIEQAQERAQARQANEEPSPVEQQPGLAMPGQGVEAEPPGAIPGRTDDQARLRNLLVGLRTAAPEATGRVNAGAA